MSLIRPCGIHHSLFVSALIWHGMMTVTPTDSATPQQNGASVAGVARQAALWLDVADLQQYFSYAVHPSGIQRVVLETIRAAWDGGKTIRICRIDAGGHVIELPREWLDLVSHPPAAGGRNPSSPGPTTPPVFRPTHRQRLSAGCRQILAGGKQLVRACLPDRLVPLAKTGFGAGRMFAIGQHIGINIRYFNMAAWHARLDGMGKPATLTPADVLVALGSPWAVTGTIERTTRALDQSGARYAFLSYDIIPASHPFYFPPGNESFQAWLRWGVGRACYAQVISRFSARALDEYRATAGVAPFPIDVVRLGDSFRVSTSEAALPAGLTGQKFVLCVSSIEARKNHRMLFDAWRLLRERLGSDCPHLVWIGRKSLLVNDLFDQLDACHWLDGLIVHLSHISDDQLASLYRSAWLTVFPSLMEGWGLPVGESLAHGKVCIASRESSIPEVGGDLALYVDPHQPRALVEQVVYLHEHPIEVQRLEQRIAEHWKPTPWSACSGQILGGLERLLEQR